MMYPLISDNELITVIFTDTHQYGSTENPNIIHKQSPDIAASYHITIMVTGVIYLQMK